MCLRLVLARLIVTLLALGSCAGPRARWAAQVNPRWDSGPVPRAVDQLLSWVGFETLLDFGEPGRIVVIEDSVPSVWQALVVDHVYQGIPDPSPCRPARRMFLVAWYVRPDSTGIHALTALLSARSHQAQATFASPAECPVLPDPVLLSYQLYDRTWFGPHYRATDGEIEVNAGLPNPRWERPCRPPTGRRWKVEYGVTCVHDRFAGSVKARMALVGSQPETPGAQPERTIQISFTLLPGVRLTVDCRRRPLPMECPSFQPLPGPLDLGYRTATDSIPLPRRFEGGWEIATHEAVAAAVGLPPLRTNLLPGRAREARISWGDGTVWRPEPMLRLVEDSDQAAGEFMRYWIRLNDSTGNLRAPYRWFTEDSSGRKICDLPREAPPWIACRTTILEPRPAWRAVADTLAALGLWDLPERGVVTMREPSSTGPIRHWCASSFVRG